MKDTDVQIFCGCSADTVCPQGHTGAERQCVVVIPEDDLFRIVMELPEFKRRYVMSEQQPQEEANPNGDAQATARQGPGLVGNREEPDQLTPQEQSRVSAALSLGEGTMINIDLAAKVAHEVNRAYCQSLGDETQIAWDDAPQWQRDSCIDGVRFLTEKPNAGPSATHDNWMQHKLDTGWTYGEVKDPEAKTHPCLVPFSELSAEQQTKDLLFHAVVRAMNT